MGQWRSVGRSDPLPFSSIQFVCNEGGRVEYIGGICGARQSCLRVPDEKIILSMICSDYVLFKSFIFFRIKYMYRQLIAFVLDKLASLNVVAPLTTLSALGLNHHC